MADNSEALSQLLEQLKTDVISSMQANGKYATGQTANDVVVVTEGNTAQLQLPGYLQALETGRGPTSQHATPGNPTMIQRIKQWCAAKGLPGKAAWAIKKSIDKKGFAGQPGIITQPLGDDNINARLDAVLENMANNTTKQISDSLN